MIASSLINRCYKESQNDDELIKMSIDEFSFES